MADFKIDTAAIGDNIIVAGVAGKRIRLTSLIVVAAGTVTLQWKSGATAKSGAMTFTSGGGYGLQASGGTPGGMRTVAYLTTNTGDDLILTLGGNVQVSGHGTWEYETG